MKKRATLSDVADIAGVTIMTVSRAINNKSGVSEEMRQKILQIAKEIDYRPNQIARGLATNQTATVGLVVPDNTNPFFAQIARGVEDLAYERGYNIILINTAEDTARETRALDTLFGKDVDGLILCSSRLPTSQLEKQVKRFPAALLINRELKTPLKHASSIKLNDTYAAKLAVGYLLEQNRKKIAYISGPANSNSAQKRLEGFKEALLEANMPLFESLIISSAPDVESGHAAATGLVTDYPDIDAIFTFNDLVAIGAMQSCLALGKRVPQDIAIIGVDDIPLASIIRPQLTTLHFNLEYIGRLAMNTLLEIIVGEVSPTAIQIEPELFIRESA